MSFWGTTRAVSFNDEDKGDCYFCNHINRDGVDFQWSHTSFSSVFKLRCCQDVATAFTGGPDVKLLWLLLSGEQVIGEFTK